MLNKYIWLLKKYIFFEFLFNAISNVALALMPYLIKILFDSFSDKSSFNIDKLITLSLLYMLCIVTTLVATRIYIIFTWKRSIVFETNLKRDFFSKIIRYSYYRFKRKDIGEYLSIQANELTHLESEYFNRIIWIVNMSFAIIMYLFSTFFENV